MELPGGGGDWLAPSPSPSGPAVPDRHDEHGVDTSIWPPADTSTWPPVGTFSWPRTRRTKRYRKRLRNDGEEMPLPRHTLSSYAPLSSNSSPDPIIRSRSVPDTSTTFVPAKALTPAPMCTPIPPMSSPRTSHSPVCNPARTKLRKVRHEHDVARTFARGAIGDTQIPVQRIAHLREHCGSVSRGAVLVSVSCDRLEQGLLRVFGVNRAKHHKDPVT